MGELLASIAVLSGFVLTRWGEYRVHKINYNALIVGGAEELIPELMRLYYRLGLLLIPLALLEKAIAGHPPLPSVQSLGIALIFLGLVIRLWSIRTLGPQWTMRCMCNYGFPIIKDGPYRLISHPEYVSRFCDGVGLCLFLQSYATLAPFVALSIYFSFKISKVEKRQLHEMASVPSPNARY